jgi:ribonucleoside-diphosphate reductase alpha chain
MREGSRPGVLERPKEENGEKKPQYLVKPRPAVVHGSTYRIDTPVGVAFITINTNGGNPPEPLEVFVNVGKAGSDIFAMAEGLGRMISLALRFSSHLSPTERIKEIIAQLQGIGGARTLGFGKEKIRSLPDAIAKAITIHYGLNNNHNHQQEKVVDNDTNQKPKLVDKFIQPSLMSSSDPGLFDLCPKCGEATFAHEEGCKKCYGCGYSEC